MTFDQLIGVSGIPITLLFFLNYAFLAYVATYKLRDIQSYFPHSRFVASHRWDADTPIVLRAGKLVLIWSLLVFESFRRLDPPSMVDVKNFPRRLRCWVVIPGYINAICILWAACIGLWIFVKGYF